MDQDIKKTWVEALRSGEYKQGQSSLKKHVVMPDGSKQLRYCCLGVLAECQNLPSKITPGYPEEVVFVFPDGSTNSAFLSSAYMNAVGMSASGERTLINMNDRGRSFDTIADYIEDNL